MLEKIRGGVTAFLACLRAAIISPKFGWALLALGAALRLRQYAANRSLWLDESSLALNVLGRSFFGLLAPLDHNQASPIGFLMLEKLAATLFGGGEYALRLVPLAAGLASLWLFYALAKRCLEPAAAALALLLFAVNGHLIYYSSDVKQYSGDVAIALLLLLAFLKICPERLSLRRAAALATVGAVALWFSHPAVFVLGAIGLTLCSLALAQRDWRRLAVLGAVGLVWAVSFGPLYVVSLRHLVSTPLLLEYWSKTFMPLPPRTAEGWRWFYDAPWPIFREMAGFKHSALAITLFAVGAVAMFRRARPIALTLLLPIALALLASGLRKYPFSNRLLLFVLPAIFLMVAEGVWAAKSLAKSRYLWVWLLLPALLLFQPLMAVGAPVASPHTPEDVRTVLEYVLQRRQAEDVLYLYHGAQPQAEYYFARWGIDGAMSVKGTDSPRDPVAYKQELQQLAGRKRVWVVFASVRRGTRVDEERYILDFLDAIGRRCDECIGQGSAAYLYDLSPESRKWGQQ